MTQTIDAIYTQGVLRPLQKLTLREQEHVRITIQSAQAQEQVSREEAMKQLIECLDRSTLSYGGRPPSREELHERDRHV
jgi:predicted DNA-binding antitoxin AbrB/MazE fold protein